MSSISQQQIGFIVGVFGLIVIVLIGVFLYEFLKKRQREKVSPTCSESESEQQVTVEPEHQRPGERTIPSQSRSEQFKMLKQFTSESTDCEAVAKDEKDIKVKSEEVLSSNALVGTSETELNKSKKKRKRNKRQKILKLKPDEVDLNKLCEKRSRRTTFMLRVCESSSVPFKIYHIKKNSHSKRHTNDGC